MATGWTVWGSNPSGARFSAHFQTGPGAHPASCTMDTGSFPDVKIGRVMTLTPFTLLVPWSRKSRATPYGLYNGALYLTFTCCLPSIKVGWPNSIFKCKTECYVM